MRERKKGQFTIPSGFREKIGTQEDTVPEKSVVEELAAAVQKEMEEYKVSLDDLLAELRGKGRHEYSKED